MICVSVLCPTRKRSVLLRCSYESLISLADDPYQVELMTAIDPDDSDFEAGHPYDMDRSIWWTAPERFGYGRLHEYYNELARQARGDWLMLWNDDALMRTRGWDTVVAEHEPALLFPFTDGPSHCNAFPIWPRSWTLLLGHVSLGAYCDTWMQEVCERIAGVEQHVPIEIAHQTPHDLTWHEGRAVTPFAGSEFHSVMDADAAKLRIQLGMT